MGFWMEIAALTRGGVGVILTTGKETWIMTCTLTSKGQLTLPIEIRQRLGLGKGIRLDCSLRPDGVIEITTLKADWVELYTALPPPRRSVTLEEMERAIQRKAAGARRRFRSPLCPPQTSS